MDTVDHGMGDPDMPQTYTFMRRLDHHIGRGPAVDR